MNSCVLTQPCGRCERLGASCACEGFLASVGPAMVVALHLPPTPFHIHYHMEKILGTIPVQPIVNSACNELFCDYPVFVFSYRYVLRIVLSYSCLLYKLTEYACVMRWFVFLIGFLLGVLNYIRIHAFSI